MMTNGTRALLQLAIALLAGELFAEQTLAARSARPPDADRFGYLLFDQDAVECGFDFVDIAASGEAVWFSASGAVSAEDDGGAVIVLGEAFEFYGEPVTSLVMSTNGYVAAASTLAAEDGGDFSNDERLPAIPDNVIGTPARLMAYHDDLSGFGTGGAAYSQYFVDCPRPSEARGAEACTVLQWSDWGDSTGGDPFHAQVVLYHSSFEIAFQIRPGATPLSGGTIGIQDARADSASQYRDTGAVLANDAAICLFEPRYPSGGPAADLEISKTDKVEAAAPGEELVYAVAVINHGPSPVAGVTVRDRLPTSLLNCTWTCLSSDGSVCTASGSGDIDDLVDLDPAGWVDYRLTCETGATVVVNTATVSLPAGVADPVPQNNLATDVDNLPQRPADCAVSARPGDLVQPSRSPGAFDRRCRLPASERESPNHRNPRRPHP